MPKLPSWLATREPEPNNSEREWVANTIAHLETFDPNRLVGRDIFPNNDPENSVAQMSANLLMHAPTVGYDALLIKQLILRQLFFAALAMGSDTSGVAAWAKEDWQLTEAQVASTLAEAEAKLPIKPPEFVSEASMSIQKAGEVMAEVWRGRNALVDFIEGTESGLRHYSLKFKLSSSTPISRVEANVRDALSHGGFHPGIRTVFTYLPYGEFEVHVPKEKDKCKPMNFMEYLWRLIEHQPRSDNDPQWFEHLVREITYHFYPQANLLKAPEIPIGIDIHGKVSSVQYGAGGLIVGAPDSGKSTNLKLTIIMLMLLYPPELFKFTAIDLKDVTFGRFTDGWRNPWTLASVITSKNARQNLDTLFEALRAEKEERAELIGKAKCENWLKYNAKNPEKPIPFSPIFIDEAPELKDYIDKAEAERFINKASSGWRYLGMPLIIGAQYAAEQHSLPPTVRQNLGTHIAFYASEACAKLAFEEKELVHSVQQLLGGGDYIARSTGSLLASHGQGFDAPEDTVDQVLMALKSMYPEAPVGSYLYFPSEAKKSYDDSDDSDDLTEDLWQDGCPKCGERVTKYGLDPKTGKQRYQCKNEEKSHVFIP